MKAYVWCLERNNRIGYSICQKCVSFESTTCFDEIQKGLTMLTKKDLNSTSVFSGITEELFLSEMKKLHSAILEKMEKLSELVLIIGSENKELKEEIKRLAALISRPNVLAQSATPVTSAKAENKINNADMDKTIKELAEKYPKADFRAFLDTVNKQFPKPFDSEEIAVESLSAIWKKGFISLGNNKYFPARPSKDIIRILASFFIGKNATPVFTIDKNKPEYWLKNFDNKLTIEKIEEVGKIINSSTKKSELTETNGLLLWPKVGIEALNEMFPELEKYPATERNGFYNHIMSKFAK